MNKRHILRKIMLAVFCCFALNGIANKTKQNLIAGADLVGGTFDLTNHFGKRVSNKDYAGKYLLVFFGFTHCPSACPVGMHTLTTVMGMLGSTAKEFQPLFITVDPERDSVEVLAEFVKRYDSRIVGLRGSLKETESLVAKYHAYYQKLPAQVDDKKNYLMDHSTMIYFMDKNGAYLSHFESSEGSQKIAKSIMDRISITTPKN
jgi:protein SCO1/2